MCDCNAESVDYLMEWLRLTDDYKNVSIHHGGSLNMM